MEKKCLKHIDTEASEIVKPVTDNAQSSLTELQQGEKGATYEIKNINWTTCENFSIDIGKQQIEEYICTWEVHDRWLYSILFLELKDMEFHKEYHYQVRWSIPTWCTPIPKATACVYFIIEISKLNPQNLPVEVYYRVEFNQLIHRPGKTRFREKWLEDIIESKVHLSNTVTF